MANKSGNTVVLTCVRATGSKDATGKLYGGVYYPAHVKNGKQINARWEGNVAINGGAWTDAQGQRQEGESAYIRLVVWNSKNAAAGKGLADIFAKCVSPGKEISCVCKIHSFMKRIFVNGQPLADAQGQPITTPAISFRVVDDVIFGDDSSKIVAEEIAAYQGHMSFNARPQMWNVVGHADNEAWKQIVAWRMAQVWDGQSGEFGYARVIIPEGAQIAAPGAQPVNQVAYGQAAPVPPAQPVAAPVAGTAPTVAAAAVQPQPVVQQPVVQPVAPAQPVVEQPAGVGVPI